MTRSNKCWVKKKTSGVGPMNISYIVTVSAREKQYIVMKVYCWVYDNKHEIYHHTEAVSLT